MAWKRSSVRTRPGPPFLFILRYAQDFGRLRVPLAKAPHCYDRRNAMRIYLAGPLFTAAEREFYVRLRDLLAAAGHEVWLPQDHEPRDKTAAAIFREDVKGLEWSEIVVANMDGPDPDSGTCWECGSRATSREAASRPGTMRRKTGGVTLGADQGQPKHRLLPVHHLIKLFEVTSATAPRWTRLLPIVYKGS